MPVCVSWLTPFTPRKPPTASHQRKGLQGWHGGVAGVPLQPYADWGKASARVL